MFVFSVKTTKKKLIIALFLIVVILVCLIFIVKQSKPVLNDNGISLKASSQAEIIAFISQFGWDIDEEPSAVEEIIIPEKFNDTYLKYNDIQKKQDFDLTKYSGKRVKLWSFNVKNYPGIASDNDCVVAHIIVYDGLVIGGDISCTDVSNKFIATFEFPDKSTTTAESTATSVDVSAASSTVSSTSGSYTE